MKKLFFVMAAIMVSFVSFISTSSASAVVRVDYDNEQVYQMEGSDLDTVYSLLKDNEGKIIELWITSDSDVSDEISDSINYLEDESYLLIYHNEWSENNEYLYSKFKCLPIE